MFKSKVILSSMLDPDREKLIKKLLKNDIPLDELATLRENITPEELSYIIQHIYDLNENYILNISKMKSGLGFLNRMKNEARQRHFIRKINNGHRMKKGHKVILAEGDSWFNYPLILTDLIDRIVMEEDLALYSIAGGGDWLLNMLTESEYVEELSVMHPDVFLISGGGNDLVGSRRLAAMIDPKGDSAEYSRSEFANKLINDVKNSQRPDQTSLNRKVFDNGCRYINKDFFALLMFFHLQYSFLITKILGLKDVPKFGPIKIVTQGYDYAIPSLELGYGLKPWNWHMPFIRNFLGHGSWLKTPLLLRGVPDEENQHRHIIYAMIYLFNEMALNLPEALGKHLPLFHIDSRGFLGDDGWADELHPKPHNALKIGEVFVDCIRGGSPTYDNVFVVMRPKV